jgi:hypothetical protein
MLQEKLLRIKAEIALVDESILGLKSQASQSFIDTKQSRQR